MIESVIQRKDKRFKTLHEIISRVKLYLFKEAWIETDIEGPLYIYKRHGTPFRRFLVYSDLTPKEYIFDINEQFFYAFTNNFLIIKRGDAIFGLWFFDEQEIKKVEKVIGL